MGFFIWHHSMGETLYKSQFTHNLGILYAYCSIVICATLMCHSSFVLWLMVQFSLLYSFLHVIFSHSTQSWVFNIFFILTSMALLNYCISPIPTPESILGHLLHMSAVFGSQLFPMRSQCWLNFCFFVSNVIFLWLL